MSTIYTIYLDGTLNNISSTPEDFRADIFLVDSGGEHTCAIQGEILAKSGGRLGCWGSNRTGQASIPSGLADDIRTVSLG
mmetsp:Transcript_65131/g.55283  ORF Transcript_65131/g.55283 Transcript_65131/m.55283 type:complete len:80 (+) Transcript_65131:166-405(+)